MKYKLFGWFWRWQACKMASAVMAGCGDDEGICPRLWSVTVFFELYMTGGADETMADFGPKEPIDLRPVETKIVEK